MSINNKFRITNLDDIEGRKDAPGSRRAVGVSPVRGRSCGRCGSRIFVEGRERQLYLCSQRECGWAVPASAEDTLLAFLAPDKPFRCSEGHRGALQVMGVANEQVEVVCVAVNARLASGVGGNSPDYVIGSGSVCRWRGALPDTALTSLSKRQREAVLRVAAQSQQQTDEDFSEPRLERESEVTVTSRPSPGHLPGKLVSDTIGQNPRESPRKLQGFLAPDYQPIHKKNEAKALVLQALYHLAQQGRALVFIEGRAYTEAGARGALGSSVAAVTGLSRGAVNQVLRRCARAHYVVKQRQITTTLGKAWLWALTPRGQHWLHQAYSERWFPHLENKAGAS